MMCLALMVTDYNVHAANNDNIVDVFYKNKKPSLKVLKMVKKVLETHQVDYIIRYHLITEPSTKSFIEKYGLPSTHFPFAVVINGIYSAKINKKNINFVEFPTFMAGIGRHEGNWSLSNLDKVLKSRSLLLSKNIELRHEEILNETHGKCEE